MNYEAQELLEDKIRIDAQAEIDELKAIKEEDQDCE